MNLPVLPTSKVPMPLEPSAAPQSSQVLPQGLDAIFIIHATPYVERRKFIEAQMQALGLPFEFVLDFDIPAIPESLRQRLFRGNGLSPAQKSCALKHWHAHQLMVQRNIARALILEDDCCAGERPFPRKRR